MNLLNLISLAFKVTQQIYFAYIQGIFDIKSQKSFTFS